MKKACVVVTAIQARKISKRMISRLQIMRLASLAINMPIIVTIATMKTTGMPTMNP